MLCLVSHRAAADVRLQAPTSGDPLEWSWQWGEESVASILGLTQKDALTSHTETGFVYLTA